MRCINNKHIPYLRKVRKNPNMQKRHKMLYHGGATSIEIQSIAFLKLNNIMKRFLDQKNVSPYLEIKQNKKEFFIIK